MLYAAYGPEPGCSRETLYYIYYNMDFSYKKIWAITFPVLISLVMEHLLGMTDAVFLGRVGEIEFGASGLGGIYYMVLYMIGFGFSIGAEILMARRNGQKQYRTIGHIFYQGTILLVGLAAVMFLISNLFSPGILRAMISSEAVYEATMSYTRWRSFGFFFSFIAIMYRAYYMATTKTKILTLNSLVMVGSNVVFNYILIFGKLGFPALGIAGAAIGSSLAELVSLIFFILYTRYRTDYKKYGMFRITRPSWNIQKQILKVASWTMIQYFISCGTWLFFFLATEHLGERTLAVSNLVRQLSSLLYLFVSAFATTGSAMVSNLMGSGGQDQILPLCRRIIKICALCTLPLFLFAALAPSLIMQIYSNNMDMIADAIPSFMVMLVSYFFSVPGYVYFLAISGTGNTKAALWIEVSILMVYVAVTYLFAFLIQTDIAVVWSVESIYGILLLATSYIYLKKAKWREKVI